MGPLMFFSFFPPWPLACVCDIGAGKSMAISGRIVNLGEELGVPQVLFFLLFFSSFFLDCDFWAHCEHCESGGGARRASGSAPFSPPPVCRGRVVFFFLICFWGHCESGG